MGYLLLSGRLRTLPDPAYEAAQQILLSAVNSINAGKELEAQALATIGAGWALLALADRLIGVANSVGGDPGVQEGLRFK
jgi:hypothetical protein